MSINEKNIVLKDEWLDMYSLMYMIRIFEKRLLNLFDKGHIGGTLHLCCGQEATAVGTCSQLSDGDAVFSTHRGHGHILAKGGDPVQVMAEILGKRDGYCNGKGGTQHMCAKDIGFMGTNGIVGGGIPIATGAAKAFQITNTKNVVVCYFGDGASSQGTFHESLNLAGLWSLPILYVCENNQYAMSNPVSKYMSGASVADMADRYHIRSLKTDGMDICHVVSVVKEILNYIKDSNRPALIEFDCYRFEGHSRSDALVYRTKAEEKEWKKRDPLIVLKNKEIMESVNFSIIHDKQQQILDGIVKTVLEMPFGTMEDALQGVYKN